MISYSWRESLFVCFFIPGSPWVALHWFPVYCIWEAELRYDPELVLCLPHELEAPLQLQKTRLWFSIQSISLNVGVCALYLQRELLRDLRQIVTSGLRFLQRHHQEVLKQLPLVELGLHWASGAGRLGSARPAQDGLDGHQPLALS